MDLSVLKQIDRRYWVLWGDDAEVCLRHITREELREIFKKATVTRFVNHQKVEEFDPAKADCLLGRAAIVDWKGFTDGGEDAPCTPEAIDLVMTRHNTFAKFINDTVIDLDYLVGQERDATAKNS
jgi:hypothetical protein